MSVQYYTAPFNSTLAYSQYDVVNGIDVAGTTHASPYFIATRDVPAGYSPSGEYNYPITAYSRSEDVTTLTYSHTGGPPFGIGAIIKVTGVNANTSVNYTGMITVGGSGQLAFVNPGYSQSASITTGAINCLCGSWSSGFCFVPDYTSKVSTQNQVITTKLGNGYEQRVGQGVNSFSQNPVFVFRNRGRREMRAITTYVQSRAGLYPFEVLIPDPFLNNQPNQKYVAPAMDVDAVSFQRYDINVSLQRVFDL